MNNQPQDAPPTYSEQASAPTFDQLSAPNYGQPSAPTYDELSAPSCYDQPPAPTYAPQYVPNYDQPPQVSTINNNYQQVVPIVPTTTYVIPMTSNFTSDIVRMPIYRNRCTLNADICPPSEDPFRTYPNLPLHATAPEFAASMNRVMNGGRLAVEWHILRLFCIIFFFFSFFSIFLIQLYAAALFIPAIFVNIFVHNRTYRLGIKNLIIAAACEQAYYSQPRDGRLPLLWFVDGSSYLVVAVVIQQ
jgi:hypothetical protein